MRVAEAVGRALAREGVDQVFGVVGSGNFHATNALVAAGARFVAARHEGGAATMADAYARVSGPVAALTVHQGCGLTNAMTGITEAAKSRTPTGGDGRRGDPAAARTSSSTSRAWPRPSARVASGSTSAESAVDDAARAVRRARDERRTVLLNLPLDVQALDCPDRAAGARRSRHAGAARPGAARRAAALAGCSRGRSGRCSSPAAAPAARPSRAGGARRRRGALLATSAVAKGLFHGNPWSLDVSGGFASPLAAELITAADLIIGWGCALNMWTMRHGRLIGPGATVVQVDLDAEALGAHATDRPRRRRRRRRATARGRCSARWPSRDRSAGYRDAARSRERIAREVRWARRAVRRTRAGDGRIDPRTFTLALDAAAAAPSASSPSTPATSWATRAMFLSVPGRARLLLHPGVPVDRPRPGDRDRRRAGAAGPAPGRRARRRRRADVRRRAGHRRAARPADGDRGLRRRGVRRGGAPLRPRRAPAGHRPVPGHRHRGHRSRLRLRRRDRARAGRSGGCPGLGATARATGRSSSTRRSPGTGAPGGSRRRSGID